MTERPLESTDLYDLQRVRSPTVSPDSERVAFVVREADENADAWHASLFVAPTDGSRDPHRLTRLPGASSPAWSPDGSKLAFLATRETDVERRVGRNGDGDGTPDDADETPDDGDGTTTDGEDAEEDRQQVWTFDLERGGDARQITDFAEGVREFDWGPAGDRVVVSARDPTDEQREYLRARREDGPIVTERLQHKYDGAGWLDEVTSYLFVVDASTGESTRLDDAYGGGAMEPRTGLSPAWSPDGSRIAFLSNRTERPDDSGAMDVYTVAPDGSDCRRLTDGDLLISGLRWRPDGERLAVVARSATNWYDTADVLVAAPDDHGKSDHRDDSAENDDAEAPDWTNVSESLDRTLARAGRPAWLADGSLLAPIGDEGRTRLARFRVDGDPERVYDQQGEYRDVEGFDAAGGTAAILLSAPDEPAEVYALPTGQFGGSSTAASPDPARRLSDRNADLRERVTTPDCERVRFENGDGEEIEAIAYLPADFSTDDSDALPLVVNVHGGPMAYDSPEFGFAETYLTGRGYAVLEVNYRGSTSYGQAFSEQIRGDWGPRESDDLLSGARELVDRGWADPDRLFVTGFSQGAINTLYVLTRTDEFAAAAAEHGVYDFYSLFGTADTHNWYESDLGLPWENPDGYRKISTIQDVGAVDTPTLLTAGEEDWRCPPWQAEQLYVRLKKRGVASKLVTYPGEHHDIGDPERAIHRLETLADWFERHDPAVDESDAE